MAVHKLAALLSVGQLFYIKIHRNSQKRENVSCGNVSDTLRRIKNHLLQVSDIADLVRNTHGVWEVGDSTTCTVGSGFDQNEQFQYFSEAVSTS